MSVLSKLVSTYFKMDPNFWDFLISIGLLHQQINKFDIKKYTIWGEGYAEEQCFLISFFFVI